MLPTAVELTDDPHPALARLRERYPVCWLPALSAWLVTSHGLAAQVLRDSGTFTVDDPRFTTARVTGPSMLSLDGAAHARHRAPFAHAFRPAALSGLADLAAAEAARLTEGILADRSADLRAAVAGPLAAAVMTQALGLAQVTPATVLAWYGDIVAAVAALAGAGATEAPAAPSFAELAASIRASIRSGRLSLLAEAAGAGELSGAETVSNAAVLLFGGIETTEGMILNALWHLLSRPEALRLVQEDPALLSSAIEESLRLEPAAAVVDRYATRDVRLGGASIRAGDPVTVSIAGANRDPDVFPDPGRYDIRRGNAARHLAFASGPHFCLGAHLARVETLAAVRTLLSRLPGLRLDPARPSAPRGLVFRKPPALHVQWD